MTRVLSLLVVMAVALGLSASPVSAARPASDDIAAYLDRALEGTGVPGLAAVVTYQDEIVHASGHGVDADGQAITEHTPMRVASLSKSFTAAAVLTLVDDGRIALDTPVVEYLPEFRMADDRARRITVRQVLNQTSGLSDTGVDVVAAERATSLADYVAALHDGSLASDPGTRWEYCNANYEVAARLVEVVGGQPFGDYLREHVFTPLGMSRSTVNADEVKPGHNSLFGLWLARPELDRNRYGGGAGGVVTTAHDLGRWLIAQNGLGPAVVTPESLAVMHRPVGEAEYGMGWGLQRIGDRDLLVHSGNLFTYTAVQAVDPASGWGFAVLLNSAGLHDDAYDVLVGLVELSGGRTPEIPGGGRQGAELALGLLAFAATGLGVLGVMRSRRWARRRAGTAWWRTLPRWAALGVPIVLLVAYPELASVLMNGRTVTWAQVTYFALPLTVTLAAAALAATATVVARVIAVRSVESTR
ncbi:serine hydrolase [Saccharomonospora sp. NB11]|jgi:CubicO group peptidase (beta-lactamase class C family)|uniref:serine hydrolase domain-containing protein n=1 Tax=Saccharomonospora sp. NB11 TaxID=1642298 RepID=UPI0018D01E16|nr:serine hydrolase domain-containing protein [Saccharomonospora sp. NB11]